MGVDDDVEAGSSGALANRPPTGGPRPETEEEKAKVARDLARLEIERKQLLQAAGAHAESRDEELKGIKRAAAECRSQVEEIKARNARLLEAQVIPRTRHVSRTQAHLSRSRLVAPRVLPGRR